MNVLLKWLVRGAGRRIVRLYAVRAGVNVGRGVHIGPGTILSSFSELFVGDGVYIGKGCTIQVSGSIGRGTLIANRVGIVGRNDHDLHAQGIPISYAPWIGGQQNALVKAERVDVGEDVWIGYGAVVMSGVSIGRGAVIGAGSVVTQHVPAYTIAAGNPARVIGERFAPERIKEHEVKMEIFWTNWDGKYPVTYE